MKVSLLNVDYAHYQDERSRYVNIFSVMSAGFFLLLIASQVLGQDDRIRSIDTDSRRYPGCPFLVTYSIDGKASKEGMQGIVAGKDWMNEVILQFRNTSERTITAALMNLEIPQRNKIPKSVIPIVFPWGGESEVDGDGTPTGRKIVWKLKPGQVATWKPQRRYDLADVDTIKLHIYAVEFDGNTRWGYGRTWDGPLFKSELPKSKQPERHYQLLQQSRRQIRERQRNSFVLEF